MVSKKAILFLVTLSILILVLFGCTSTSNDSLSSVKSDVNSYIACGCGCCGSSSVSNEVCLYKEKGEKLSKIISDDLAVKNSLQCANVGCSVGTLYKYCD